MSRTKKPYEGRGKLGGDAYLESMLVDFFRGEGAVLGIEGDDASRTPAEQALHSLRELMKIRSDLERARRNNTMRLAIPTTCVNGHAYYFEAHAHSECPYCLKIQVGILQSMRDRIRGHLAYALAAVK